MERAILEPSNSVWVTADESITDGTHLQKIFTEPLLRRAVFQVLLVKYFNELIQILYHFVHRQERVLNQNIILGQIIFFLSNTDNSLCAHLLLFHSNIEKNISLVQHQVFALVWKSHNFMKCWKKKLFLLCLFTVLDAFSSN